MGRRVKAVLGIVGVVGLTTALVTCFNPFDILSELETQVKIANDLFLEIESVAPAKNAAGVQPGSDIVIEFDRAVDESTIGPDTIVFDPAPDPLSDAFQDLEFEYNEDTYTLTVNPKKYMDGPVEYTVKITQGVKGGDGSELQTEYTWAFNTKEWPAGEARIDVDSDFEADEYINADTPAGDVKLVLLPNPSAKAFRYSTNESLLPSLIFNDIPAQQTVDLTFSTDGEHTVHVQFANNTNGDEVSNTEIAAITRDTVDPSVTLSDTTFNMYTGWPATLSPNATDATSGIGACSWTADKGGITFGAANVKNAVINAASDTTYILTLEAYDKAGNGPVSDSMTLTVDTVPTSAPTVSSSTYTTSRFPNWTWTTPSGAVGFRRSLDGGSWYSTTATIYTVFKYPLDYGDHDLRVQAKDAAGNYSGTGTKAIHIHPDIAPSHGETVPRNGVTLDWDPIPGANVVYEVYLGTNPSNMSKVASSTSATAHDLSRLAGNERYYWGIVAKTGKTVLYTSPMSQSTPYTFETSWF